MARWNYTALDAKDWARRLKGVLDGYKIFFGCEICGFQESAAALDFHHIDPAQKSFKVTTSARTAWETRLAEMEKCAVLCANCHRRVHAGEFECS